MNEKDTWTIETNHAYPYDKILLYKGQEVSLEEVLYILNGYALEDIQNHVETLRLQLKKYETVINGFKELLNIPEDTQKELELIDERISAVGSSTSGIERRLFKYNLR